MKTVKKILIIAAILLMLLLLVFLISIPIVNDSTAKHTAEEVRDYPMPEKTVFAEMFYRAGKLVGNGNGMQYLGGILVQSELSEEQLQAHYTDFEVRPQSGKELDIIEHGSCSLTTEISGDGYYIIYTWGHGNEIYRDMDLRGH